MLVFYFGFVNRISNGVKNIYEVRIDKWYGRECVYFKMGRRDFMSEVVKGRRILMSYA